MRKFLLVSFLFVGFFHNTLHCFAQKVPFTIGQVSDEELDMQACSYDSAASALVLYDYGTVSVELGSRGPELVMDCRKKVKIFKKDGYRFADVEIPVHISNSFVKEEISNIKATTYCKEGDRTEVYKLESKDIHEEKVNEFTVLKKFALPKVKEGAVIEYAYTLKSPFIEFLKNWVFQDEIPVLWSEYRVSYPEFFAYKKMAMGYAPFHVNKGDVRTTTDGNLVEYRWVCKDLTALRPEKYTSCMKDYAVRINFQLESINVPGIFSKTFNRTWQEAAGGIIERQKDAWRFGDKDFLKSVVGEITQNLSSEEEKLKAVFKHIRKNMRWNKSYDIRSERGFKKMLESGIGSVADINILLAEALRIAGLQAAPVYLSTRGHGKVIIHFPFLDQFNYVVAAVRTSSDKLYLLDATDPLYAPDIISPDALNGVGLMIDRENLEWIPLKRPESGITTLNSVFLDMSDMGEATGRAEHLLKNYAALAFRSEILKEGKSKTVTKIVPEDYLPGGYKDVVIENENNPDEPIRLKYPLKIKGTNDEYGKIYFSPLLYLGTKENMFKTEQRILPVDLNHSIAEDCVVSLKLPKGYVVDELPQSTLVTLEGNAGEFEYRIAVSGDVLQVRSKIFLNETYFEPDTYPDLRSFFDMIVKKHGEQIILKRADETSSTE